MGIRAILTLRRSVVFGVATSLAVVASAAMAQLPSFNGAEGFGGTFTGSAPAGGWFSDAEVYHVTTTQDILLNGKGAPGTLRGAFVDFTNINSTKQKASNRIVVFDVGGTFVLTQGKLDIKEVNNIYVAGQTAPSPVTVYGNMTQITKSNDTMTSNVILRYMTFRKGTGPEEDSISFIGGDGPGDTIATHMILDHVTASWSEDENISVANNNTNVTVQYSIIHDALVSNHAYGSLIRPKVDSNVTFHHNLYANNASRQARFGTYNAETLTADFRNNVVYNWRDRASYAGGSDEAAREYADVNYVGNYLIAGPGSLGHFTKAFDIDKNIDARVYQSGNFIDGDKLSNVSNPGGLPNGADTGWGMFQISPVSGSDPIGTLTQLTDPLATSAATTQSAIDAYIQVLKYVGNYWWSRDAIDMRVINDVETFTGPALAQSAPIASELASVIGPPVPPATTRPADWDTENNGFYSDGVTPKANGDGMPALWEIAHGLNPNVNDAFGDFDNDGFVNVQEYLDEIGAIPAPTPLTYVGAASGPTARYALITNWKTADWVDIYSKVAPGSNWQPTRFDEARINSGTVAVDVAGQHAGVLKIGAVAAQSATLNITSGWLDVANQLVIGADPGATALVNLSGGVLSAPTINKGAGGSFSFTGGMLHADTVNFDLVNNGGTIAPGNSIGQTHVVGDMTLNSGSLHIELASASSSDTLLVDGIATLGGNLDVMLLGGFTPTLGNSWAIIAADNILSQFASITNGYSVQKQGDILRLFFGPAPPDGLPGDFNEDGTVDAADYVVWRSGLGTTYTEADYDTWQANFGATILGGTVATAGLPSSAVPEPATWALLAVAAVAGWGWSRLRAID